MEKVWLDVTMWTPLRGDYLPFNEVQCDAPDPLPATEAEWEQWAVACLAEAGDADGWQDGRYHYAIQQRSDSGVVRRVFLRGIVERAPR